MSKPLVSIIINSHNNLEYLNETIDSALAQTYAPIEIILYDNASTQDLSVLKQQYGEKIQYHRSEIFLTLGQARNEALKLASGELIDYLDSDDLFHPEKVEKLVSCFDDPKVGLALCNTTMFRTQQGRKIERLMNQKPLKEGHRFADLINNYDLSFVATMFRKSAIGDSPEDWFPQQFNICTDFDLFLKISHSYTIRYVDEALCSWRFTGENWSVKKKYMTPIEKMMMVPRILSYEPLLFKKYKKEMSRYFGLIYSDQYHYYWQKGFKKEAFFSALHSFSLSLKAAHLMKALMIPFLSWERYKKLYPNPTI
jgi:glycosyltransferase involved in cell wall biosynthesis